MSADHSDDGFTLVVSRRQKRRIYKELKTASQCHGGSKGGMPYRVRQNMLETEEDETVIERQTERTLARVETFRQELLSSSVYHHICALLSSEILGLKPKIIIAYGLGSFVTSQEACRQLALCQLLGQFLSVQKVSGFDPIWSAADKRVFSRLGFECETHNDRGARPLDCRTLVYMPHCPRGLYANILAYNWTPERFQHFIMLGNRLDAYIERLSNAQLRQYMPHLTDASKMLHARPIQLTGYRNHDQHTLSTNTAHIDADRRAFNDLCLHWPDWSQLPAATDACWTAHSLPQLDDLSPDTQDPELL